VKNYRFEPDDRDEPEEPELLERVVPEELPELLGFEMLELPELLLEGAGLLGRETPELPELLGLE